jgi:hypothetical protein
MLKRQEPAANLILVRRGLDGGGNDGENTEK